MSSPPAPAPSRVARTLAEGRLGVASLVCIVMAAAAPLTVVAGGATTAFAVTGVLGIPVAYLVVAVILAVFSVGYLAMSRRIVNAGAFYTYVSHGFGKPPGVGAAFVAVLAYATMLWGLLGGFGAVLSGFLDTQTGIAVPWWVLAAVATGVIAVLGVLKINLNGRILAVLLIGEVGIALLFGFVAVAHPSGGTVSLTTLSPGLLIGAGAGAALVTAITGFVGFENTAVFSEESRDPQRTVARATYLALGIIGLLYGFVAWAMSVAVGPDNIVQASRDAGTELLFTIVGPYVGNTFLFLGHLLFATSLFAAALSFHNTGARYLFALGREGVVPRSCGAINVRTRAPMIGSLIQSSLSAIVITIYAIAGWDPLIKLFFWLTVLGGLGVLLLMVITSSAVVRFFARADDRATGAWTGVIAPGLAAVALVGILLVTVLQFDTLLGVEPDNGLRWQLPALYAAAFAVGLCWAYYLKTRRPNVYAGIGLGANSVLTDRPAPIGAPA